MLFLLFFLFLEIRFVLESCMEARNQILSKLGPYRVCVIPGYMTQFKILIWTLFIAKQKKDNNKIATTSGKIYSPDSMQNLHKCHTFYTLVTLWLHKPVTECIIVTLWRDRRAMTTSRLRHCDFTSTSQSHSDAAVTSQCYMADLARGNFCDKHIQCKLCCCHLSDFINKRVVVYAHGE